MKATGQSFPVLLLITLYNVVLTFMSMTPPSVPCRRKLLANTFLCCVNYAEFGDSNFEGFGSIQMKAVEFYFLAVQFIML